MSVYVHTVQPLLVCVATKGQERVSWPLFHVGQDKPDNMVVCVSLSFILLATFPV